MPFPPDPTTVLVVPTGAQPGQDRIIIGLDSTGHPIMEMIVGDGATGANDEVIFSTGTANVTNSWVNAEKIRAIYGDVLANSYPSSWLDPNMSYRLPSGVFVHVGPGIGFASDATDPNACRLVISQDDNGVGTFAILKSNKVGPAFGLDTGWLNPVLGASVAQFGGTYDTCQVRYTSAREVRFKGMLNVTTVIPNGSTAPVVSLPAGVPLPAARRLFTAPGANGPVRLDLQTNGDITAPTGCGTGYLSMETISYIV